MCYYVNNMKRIIPAILLLLALTGCYNSGEPRERVLKIYNWADYIGEGVLEDFQAYYKVRISVSFTRHSISTKSC
jgi:spermidine/putrescine transport system substrate-binding protein